MSEVPLDPIEASRALEQRERDALEGMRFAAEREAMSDSLQPPNWAKWSARGQIELWQLVALTLDIEPVKPRRLVYFEARHDRPAHVRSQVVEIELLDRLRDSLPYSQRLAEACSWIGLDAGLDPRRRDEPGGPERTPLPRGAFVTWAQRKGWPMPDAMAQWAHPGEAVIPSGTAVNPVPHNNDRGERIIKAELIARHVRRWTSIERDLRDASENGLSAAAKAEGKGWWWEGSALEWARARNKLDASSSATTSWNFVRHECRDS